MAVTIYHNPRCAKSREALALLEAKGIAPRILRYLEQPPSPAEIKALLRKLGLGARDILRKKEKPYAELHLGDPDLADDLLIRAMASHPILIERPIIVAGARAIVGRPAHRILELL
jgi:arsenate reductase (glutaredoxin)